MVLTSTRTDGIETDVKDDLIAEMVYVSMGRDDSTAEGVGNTDLDDEVLLYFGDNTTQIQVSNQGGNTWRYEWTTGGADPDFQTNGLAVNDVIRVKTGTFSAGNVGDFTVAAVTDNYFEVTNPAGAPETVVVGDNEAFGKANRKSVTLSWNAGTHTLTGSVTWDNTELNGYTLKEIGAWDGNQLDDSLQLRDVLSESIDKDNSKHLKIELEIVVSVEES